MRARFPGSGQDCPAHVRDSRRKMFMKDWVERGAGIPASWQRGWRNMEGSSWPEPERGARVAGSTPTCLWLYELQGHCGEQKISACFCDQHQQKEAQERLTHHARDHRQRVTDDRHPAEQQRPLPEAPIGALRALELIVGEREPTFVTPPRDVPPQQPVDHLAEYVAGGRHSQ